MYNLRNQKIDFDYQPQYITEEVHNGKLARSRTEAGDLLMNIVGPPLGKLAIIPVNLPQANFNQAAVLIRPYAEKVTLVSYLKAYLEEMSEINSIATRGSAGQVNISLTQSQNMRIPLPPLNEQQRLLVELNRWMGCVSMIENGKEELTNTVNQVKSKILDLAIHGKLVPQDPMDEPAIELLRRINPKFTPCDNGHYTQLPQGWCWVSLGEIAEYINGRAFKPEEWETEGLPIIRIQNLNAPDAVYNYSTKNYESKYLVCNGDLLFAWAASLGTYIWNGGNAWLNQHIFKVQPKNCVDRMFLYFCLEQLISEFYKESHGSGMVHITRKKFESITVLLPPLREQHRIVEAIQSCMSVLNCLQNNL